MHAPTEVTGEGKVKNTARSHDTPMMQQFWSVKNRFPRHLIFFRMGDFFELFHEDARIAARVLGLTLTKRSKEPDAPPMAGVPVRTAEQYLARLLRKGFSVAVCDQLEDPALAKGIVKRDVTRVVTPGTVVEENLLDARKPNRLVAILPATQSDVECSSDLFGVAAVDLSNGAIYVQQIQGLTNLLAELARLDLSECLIPEPLPVPGVKTPPTFLPPTVAGKFSLSQLNPEAFSIREAQTRLQERFDRNASDQTALKKLARALPLAYRAAGALVGYIEATYPKEGGTSETGASCGVDHLQVPRNVDPDAFLFLDETAIHSLELIETIRDRSFEGTLLWSIDRTLTSAGARRLREWLLRPSREAKAILRRQDSVAQLVRRADQREALQEAFKEVADMERIAARLATRRATPRDLVALKNSLRMLPQVEAALAVAPEESPVELLEELRQRLTGLNALADRIESTLLDECPLTITEGGLIKAGFHPDLDRLREISSGGKQWIANFQAKEAARAKIPLKIGYNRVFGYYIEISKTHVAQAPADYERRQTLTTAERFVTPELKQRESEVLGAEDKSRALEHKLFLELRDELARHIEPIRAAGVALSELDALYSLATVAVTKGHVRPNINNGLRCFFSQLRHPVLEDTLNKGCVVPNDIYLDARDRKPGSSDELSAKTGFESAQVLLLTGPNMAGKSTYIRSVALGVILAQMGAFVPAEQAEIGIVDRIFTRVGAADDLAGGRSTFMVEMTEVAEILAHASERSLVVLDEVGRGTSTYDGVSLAWSILEYLQNGRVRPRTLFATHYHELCTLEEEYPRLMNASAVVKEWQGEITFLYRIAPGSSERSFGLHVARLAGLPEAVISRARTILHELEEEAKARLEHVSNASGKAKKRRSLQPTSEDGQLLLFDPTPEQIDPEVKALLDELRSVDINKFAPMDAMTLLERLSRRARGLP